MLYRLYHMHGLYKSYTGCRAQRRGTITLPCMWVEGKLIYQEQDA